MLREARSAAALNYSHICTIHEVGKAEGHAYIAMEFIDGRSLDRLIPTGGFPVAQVLRDGLQITDAVAHGRGVVHRDLKSANVMMTPKSRAKVLDFGLAKRVSWDERTEATTQSLVSVSQPGA